MKKNVSCKKLKRNISYECLQKNENKANNSIVIEIYYYSHNYVLTNKMKNY